MNPIGMETQTGRVKRFSLFASVEQARKRPFQDVFLNWYEFQCVGGRAWLQLAHPFCVDNFVLDDMDHRRDRMSFHPDPAHGSTNQAGNECQAKQPPDSHDGSLDDSPEKDIKDMHIASQKA